MALSPESGTRPTRFKTLTNRGGEYISISKNEGGLSSLDDHMGNRSLNNQSLKQSQRRHNLERDMVF